VAQFELPAERQSVRVARVRTCHDQQVMALSEADQADVTLIVSELVSNAIEAAAVGTMIVVDILSGVTGLVIAVSNQGEQRLTNLVPQMSGGGTGRGRGLALVSMLSREVTVTEKEGRTTVQALF
jgi:anti-sigma regulatory factor (Ser/Thr protein kinase)